MAKKSRYNTKQRKENRSRETEYIKDLEQKIKDYDVKVSTARFFEDLPIGEKTLKGLKENAFLKMTDIQKESIPMCLKGFDVLGSAKTGSGKTLAFLIPVLEKLYRESWTEFDGLGALIISPTRELAMQIYEVLIKIGKYCSFSAGLVIGGKDVKFEMERISKMNILVGTPGRILQHMDQSVGFDTSTLQMLVLDEADRCLDMGFSKTLDSIVSNLPPSRQTLLYSATQSQSLESLARLSLTNYKTCGESLNSLVKNMTSDKNGKDNKSNQQNTPEALRQSYITVELPDKLDILYSFIKTHLKHKIIVFLSSSKQVHFVYETFRKLQPGISLMHLHGRQKQTARTDTLDKFSRAQHVVLFATDVVSRGIDFPAVDWVVQVDCPEDVDTYIHRAGRCARNGKGGDNLLMLTPQEEPGMLSRMKSKHIEPSKLNIKASKKKSIKPQLQSLLFKDPELKYLGQKAFISYIKSIYIQKDKEVFQFETLPTEDFAKSLGLPGAPKIKIKGMKSIERAKELKNSSRQLMSLAKANDNGDVVDEKSDKPKTKIDKMFQRKNQNVLSEHYMNITKQQGDDDEEDDFMTVKRQDHELKEEDLPELILPTSKRAQKKALSKKASLSTKGNPTKVRFDDEGTAHPIYELMGEEEFHKEGDVHTQKETFISKEREVLAKADIDDKELAKEKKQEKKRKRLEQMRKEMEADISDFSDYEDDHQADGSRYDVGTGNLSDDMESDDEQAKSYKRRRFNDSPTDDESDDDDRHNVIEVEEPQTLEDLESLTAKLIQG